MQTITTPQVIIIIIIIIIIILFGALMVIEGSVLSSSSLREKEAERENGEKIKIIRMNIVSILES